MSLYNNVAKSLNVSGGINGAIAQLKSAVGGYANRTMEQVRHGDFRGLNAQSMRSNLEGMARTAASDALRSMVGAGLSRGFESVFGMSGFHFPGIAPGGGPRNTQFMQTVNPLMGGITPARALQIFTEMQSEQLARKNLFSVSVTSALANGAFDMPDKFQFFCTDVELQPCQAQGDKAQIGGAAVDLMSGQEAVQITLTTLDDAAGSLKRWFERHFAASVSQDGTISEPGKYAITIKVTHMLVDPKGSSPSAHFVNAGIFRPESLQISLSRREDNLEELQMTFTQLDTFMPV